MCFRTINFHTVIMILVVLIVEVTDSRNIQ